MPPSLIAGATFAALLLSGDVKPPEPLKSGPQVGAGNSLGGFFPQFVAGASAGQHFCPV